jgi:SAM-dependent methyltransferase
MEYDPIKKYLGNFFNRSSALRVLFYRLLDLLLLRSWHIRKELRKWKKVQSGELNVLDAGSGFGQYTFQLAKMGKDIRVKAIDVKEDQISECNTFFGRTRYARRVGFEVADLTVFKAAENFDLILSVDVMEHIAEDELVFRNFYHSLKPGGMLLISTPSDKGGSDVHDDQGESFIGEHVRNGYGVEEISEKLKKAGFDKVLTRYSYGWPGKISWKLSMKFPVILLNHSKLFILILPFYYLLVYPFCFLLNFMDVNMNFKTGTGLIVKALK